MNNRQRISKTLSPNDIGETGGHQAGILVPKSPEILGFFPRLDPCERNPRVHLVFCEDDGLTRWEFAFIYYNNALHGGTRNEYRLTRMTRYLRNKNAGVGDEVVLTRDAETRLLVALRRNSLPAREDGVLRLTGGWKVIKIK